MRRQRWWLPILAIVFATTSNPTLSLPVRDEELDTSTKLLGSSVVTSVSVVTGSPGNAPGSASMNADRSRVIPSKELPSSPANLLRPDSFQFYTLNKDGSVVTKKMTEREIQSLIAAGGGHPPVDDDKPQNAGDIRTGGMQVTDVLENVQKVLKDEMNKLAPVMTSMPTIPGHANTEWSSILPAIFGGESDHTDESSSTTFTDADATSFVVNPTLVKIPEAPITQTSATRLPAAEPSTTTRYEIKKKPANTAFTQSEIEKPMIQVPVITVEQKLPSSQDEENSTPVFQMLNTISADKINARNNTQVHNEFEAVKPQKIDVSEQKETAKPAKTSNKPTPQHSGLQQSANTEVPEMVEISLNEKVSIKKPDSMIITAENIPEAPQTEAPAMVSVVSETHSTSMKVSGHEEVPLREPPKPVIKPDDRIELPVEEKKPAVTEKPASKLPTDDKLDSTTVRTKPSEAPTPEKPTETPEKPSLIAQGVSFFEKLPETVGAIVTDFIYNNSSTPKPTVEKIVTLVPIKPSEDLDKLVEVKDSVKKNQTTETTVSETTAAPIRETVTSKKPDQEPVYQMIPEIIPDKKTPSLHGSSPSEATSIEHIIETLNDPASSASGTPVADPPSTQANPIKPVIVAETKTSTAATPIKVETSAESSPSKPVEPLPTELADSLSSMISQISDAMTSVVPVGQDAGLDTTGKKNVIDMLAEEPSGNETTSSEIGETSKITEKPALEIKLPLSDQPEKTEIVDVKLPENKEPTIAPAEVSEATEITKEIQSTTYVPMTSESPSQDTSTKATSELPLIEIMTTQVPVNPIDKLEVPVVEKLDIVPSSSENSKPDADSVLASSEIATDKIMPVSIEQSDIKNDTSESAVTEATLMEKISTEKPATTLASSATSVVTTTVSYDDVTSPKDQTDSPLAIASTTLAPESQKNFTSMKVGPNENNTEMPIVHIAITETKPAHIANSNKTQGLKNENKRPESPVVRIQLTDPVTVANNMIASANVSATAGPLVPLILPETGSVPPNSIASGLIAGFPSTTTQATPEENPTTIPAIKFQPEIQPIANGSLNHFDDSSKPSEIQTKNITYTEISQTPEIITESSVTESIEVVGTTTLKNVPAAEPEITVPVTNSPIDEVAADEPQEKTTAHAVVLEQATSEKPERKESVNETAPTKSVDSEAAATPPVLETASNGEDSSRVSESVTVVLEETTTEISTTSTAATIVDKKTNSSAPAISEPSDSNEKVTKLSEIIETTVSTSAKPEVTAAPMESSEEKTQLPITAAPEKLGESKNHTMSELPVVRIDVESEAEFNKMPSKIQAPDFPIVAANDTTAKPMAVEEIQTQTSQSATTAQTPIESTSSSKILLPSTTVSSIEKTEADITKDKPKLEDAVKQPVKVENNSSEKVAATSNPISMPQQTEEIRIRVNDTAVLVTKRPVSETTGQTLENVQKTTVNQSATEQPTTPETSPVTEGSVSKDIEKVESLPVPVKVNELSSSQNAAPIIPLTKTETTTSSGSKNHSTPIEVQRTEETTTLKADDSRKPVQKNSDSDSSQTFQDVVFLTESSTNSPPTTNDEILIHGDNDSHVKPSTKVEVTTRRNSDDPSTPSTISSTTKPEDKPSQQTDVKVSVAVTDKPNFTTSKPALKPTMNIKKDDALPEPVEEKWTLIPQQVYPALTKTSGAYAKQPTTTATPPTTVSQPKKNVTKNRRPGGSMDHRPTVNGLDCTVKDLDPNMLSFADLCNELAFTFWTATNESLSQSRSLAVSPFGMTSLLAMVFLGAREPTSSQMNSVLKLDDNNSFNPHLVFHNITEAVRLARHEGIANAAFVRELFVDRSKVRGLMPFYKKQAQQFYDGIVEEAYFDNISELVRRRTNHKMKQLTERRIDGFMANTVVPLRSPLAAMSANVFQTNCNDSAASSEGRDGELYFAVSPASRQRKLVPVPATVWKSGVLGGYVTSLDATAVALGGIDKLVSTIFVIPGNQGHTAPGDSLDQLEQRFIKGATHDDAWKKLLKVLIPRPGLELQVPKFSHRSIINATAALKRMGLKELFSKEANLKAIKGVAPNVHLADIFQINLFSTCGDGTIQGASHHAEIYPNHPERKARGYRNFEEKEDELVNDSAEDETTFSDSTIPHESVAQREARWDRQSDGNTEKTRVKLDRPFLYFVRHNPTGLILHMGRFNPRLLSSTNSGDSPIKPTTPVVSTIPSFKRDRSKSRD